MAAARPPGRMRQGQKSPERARRAIRPGMARITMETLLPSPLPVEAEDPARTHQLIARRAEEIWRQLGRPAGRDLAIWLEAEAEISAIRDRSFRHPRLPAPDDE